MFLHVGNRSPNKPSHHQESCPSSNNSLPLKLLLTTPFALRLILCLGLLTSSKMNVLVSCYGGGQLSAHHSQSNHDRLVNGLHRHREDDKSAAKLSNDINLGEWPRISKSANEVYESPQSNANNHSDRRSQQQTDLALDLERNHQQHQQRLQHDNDNTTLSLVDPLASTQNDFHEYVKSDKPFQAKQYEEAIHLTAPLNHINRNNKTSRSVDAQLRAHGPVGLVSLASAPASLGHPLLDLSPALFLQQSESKRIKREHDPDCALILKRTYILKSAGGGSDKDEWGDKFVFNDVDPDDAAEMQKKKKQVHKTDLCIKHSDVDKAFQEAKHRIKFEKPKDLDNVEVDEHSLASIGELNLATGLLLTKRFDLSPDEILNALPMIDVSSSMNTMENLCPKNVSPMVCMKSRYRTITGHCNNLKHPAWGASKTPYSRYLPPDYADGLSLPRASVTGKPLPSARLITSKVHVDVEQPTHDYSILFADWGQLLNHDITRVAVGEAPDCCPKLLKGLCMPIPVPEDDPLYSEFNVKCLKFDRSLAAIRPKCLLGHRAQINLITSPIDASFVYGSTKQQAQQLRTFSEGKMKAWNFFDKLKLKPLLPPKVEEPDKDCLARPKQLFCFVAGDVRVNEQTHLTVLHTIYLREHNRIAKQLAKINMEWDDERLYHETRHIVAACMQHVVVNEFLPLLLGQKNIADYQFKPSPGFWNGYDPRVTISTGTAFASAAFRYGHSMIDGTIKRMDPRTGEHIRSDLLRFLFKSPFMLYEPGAIDQLLAGMLLAPAEHTDPFVSEELSGHLFQPPKAKFGHDLAAINIQRGRDQGVPGYNDWREWCGLKRAKSFSDLEPLLMNHTAWHYSKIYKHVDDIDLWSAGISERKMANAAVGPTLGCIISRQFLNYKRGDRFWYENPGQPSSFTAAQLREIKKMSLAKILCTNADDLPRIQPWAMRLPHPIYNAKVSCDSLPTINLKHWDSSSTDNL